VPALCPITCKRSYGALVGLRSEGGQGYIPRSASKQLSSEHKSGESLCNGDKQKEALPNILSKLVLHTEVSGLGALGQWPL
jgi:hypothetical protein